jgi:hypothetical protein
MTEMTAGITRSPEAIDNTVWQILGQTYTLKHVSPDSMTWHAVFPPGTFVPPHIHPAQDEFIYVLTGRYDLFLDGKELVAEAGDLVRIGEDDPAGDEVLRQHRVRPLVDVPPPAVLPVREPLGGAPGVIDLVELHGARCLEPPQPEEERGEHQAYQDQPVKPIQPTRRLAVERIGWLAAQPGERAVAHAEAGDSAGDEPAGRPAADAADPRRRSWPVGRFRRR